MLLGKICSKTMAHTGDKSNFFHRAAKIRRKRQKYHAIRRWFRSLDSRTCLCPAKILQDLQSGFTTTAMVTHKNVLLTLAKLFKWGESAINYAYKLTCQFGRARSIRVGYIRVMVKYGLVYFEFGKNLGGYISTL